ncbi:MAG: hypothetical protein ACUVX8_11900, partial [Candidatus Zipacnadales bacterium]
GQSSDGLWTCVRLKDRDHLIIEGLQFLPARGGWMKLDSAKHCVIRNCYMEHATGVYSPIECRGCHYNRYENLQCLRAINLGEGGHVAGDLWNNFDCSHNVFEHLYISRAGHRPFGMWFDCPYNVVRNCVFDCRWGRNFEFFSTPRLLMEGCVITNGFDGSGSADGRAKLFIIDSIFRRNVIYRNYYGPLVINSYQWETTEPWGMMRSRLYHNTWALNYEYGYEMIDLGENPETHYVAGNIFRNNVFAFNDPGGDGLALLLYSNIGHDNLFRYNLLFGFKPGDKTVRYDWTFPGLSEWPGLTMTATEANEQKPDQFVGNLDGDPLFCDLQADDYRLRKGSPCLNAGEPLTRVMATGSGREMLVDDARAFYDGWGIPGERGDLIFIGSAKTRAVVVKADIERNTLTLDREVAWQEGEGVFLPYTGKAPDLGAYERDAEHESWYTAPTIPPGLQLETMATASKPVVVTDFELEDLEDWFYYWNFSRQRNTNARVDDTTTFRGRRCMRVYAEADGATLSCDIRPRCWNIDRFPTVRFAYRIPPHVPVAVWIHAFKSTNHGQGAVCMGGTATRDVGRYRDLGCLTLIDDDQWHEAEIDVRRIREVFPDVTLLQMLRFYTNGNGRHGHQYWFDYFRILPEEYHE